jgi:DNA-binding response OmpR family regulator
VILLDNHLPGVNGVDALPALLESAPGACILMLTISEDEDDLAAALRNGASGYLLKTMEGDALTAAIRRAMQGRKRRRAGDDRQARRRLPQRDEEGTGKLAVLIVSTLAFTVCFMVWMMFGVIGIPIKKATLGLNATEFGLLTATPVLTGSLIRVPWACGPTNSAAASCCSS